MGGHVHIPTKQNPRPPSSTPMNINIIIKIWCSTHCCKNNIFFCFELNMLYLCLLACLIACLLLVVYSLFQPVARYLNFFLKVFRVEADTTSSGSLFQ